MPQLDTTLIKGYSRKTKKWNYRIQLNYQNSDGRERNLTVVFLNDDQVDLLKMIDYVFIELHEETPEE